MGAKTCMLVYTASNAREALAVKPRLDREVTRQIAGILFPDEKLEPIGEVALTHAHPPDHEVYMGCFPGVLFVAAREFGLDRPSTLPRRFIDAGGSGTVILHAMHSAVDWFAYAIWRDGKIVRSLSLSPDSGILENIGERLPFEEPYWSGKFPALDGDEPNMDYPFPFHPMELGEAALKDQFGYQIEGCVDASLLDPDSIPLIRYKRPPSPRPKAW
ncbi:MAG: hypothetical protein ABFD69_02375 [Candidatus Sumerlaeia bacterium]